MKRLSILKIFTVLIAATIFLVTCTKENSDIRLDPKLNTSQVLNVNWDSASVVGYVIAAGSGFSEKGVCYNTATGPTTANDKVVFSGDSKTAAFTVKLVGLTRLTKYYARAYAINDAGTIYGEEMSFTTTAAKPTLADIGLPVLAIGQTIGVSATTEIDITDDGGPDATADIVKRGVVYGFYPHPTVDSPKTVEGTGKGQFTSLVNNLKGNKTYYFRAYASNKIGSSYSNEVSFTTPVTYGVATTSNISQIGKTTATFSGLVTYNGGGTITEKGFVYSTSTSPTVADTKVAVVSSTDTITADVTGLSKYTGYHMRAFVTNDVGTNYGDDMAFSTLADILTWYIPGDYVEASYPGSSFANWSPATSPFIMSTIAAGDKLEGYVYMANGSNAWKFASQPNWDGPNYGDDNSSGNLNPSAANNISSTAGYYKLNVDATAMTYTAVATSWGVIGDATPGGWGDETALTYSPTAQTWQGAIHLTAASFKFRANHDWGFNYGSSAGDETLNPDGSNISATVEDDYAFTLDLSHPNAYTYSANRWGVIGDATADGWNSDQNMSWDAGNQVFTATLSLTTGAIKFRANDGWDINYGGNLNALTPGGDNIPIGTAGSYIITFNPWTLVGTVTANKKK